MNTDISSPSVLMKRYKADEDQDKTRVKPMLIDASVVDSIMAEKNKQDSQTGKLTYKQFNKRIKDLERAHKEAMGLDDESSESEISSLDENAEDPRNFYRVPRTRQPNSKKPEEPGKKKIRMLNNT